MTSHAHRQHTVSLLLFYAGEGVVQDLASSSFFRERGDVFFEESFERIWGLLQTWWVLASLFALWDMFGLVKFKISGFRGQLCS